MNSSARFQIALPLDTRSALVELMKTIARYGRPSSFPPDVREAWNECERVLGDDVAIEISKIYPAALAKS